MSGHSKWSKVKHQKATTDVVKGAAFTKAARAITLAVAKGGGVADPNHNFHLRLAIEKARDVNMPKENISRAIDKGMGVGGAIIEQVVYEGYGPNGVAVLVETATDNKTRTVAQLKNVFGVWGGSIASPGAVSYLFDPTGIITVRRSDVPYDTVFELSVRAGATDVADTDDFIEIYMPIDKVTQVAELLTKEGITIDNTVITMKPSSTLELAPDTADRLLHFIEAIENLDDVQQVYTNLAV